MVSFDFAFTRIVSVESNCIFAESKKEDRTCNIASHRDIFKRTHVHRGSHVFYTYPPPLPRIKHFAAADWNQAETKMLYVGVCVRVWARMQLYSGEKRLPIFPGLPFVQRNHVLFLPDCYTRKLRAIFSQGEGLCSSFSSSSFSSLFLTLDFSSFLARAHFKNQHDRSAL